MTSIDIEILRNEVKRVKGILDVKEFSFKDKENLIRIEKEAEEKSLFGLGKVINSGVFKVLDLKIILVALTSMEFDWGFHPSLILKKGDMIVGEEVRDPHKIDELKSKREVWFMHRTFIVYKDRITWPKDIMDKVCHFEIPAIPCEWECVKCLQPMTKLYFANPSPPGDIFLKERYFGGQDQRGLGTILVGVEGPVEEGKSGGIHVQI